MLGESKNRRATMWCKYPFWWVDTGFIFKVKTLTARKVLDVILGAASIKAGEYFGECFIAFNTIARKAKISRSSAIRGINELLKVGIVSKVDRDKKSNSYKLTLSKPDSVIADTSDGATDDTKGSVPNDTLKRQLRKAESRNSPKDTQGSSVYFAIAEQLLQLDGEINSSLLNSFLSTVSLKDVVDPKECAKKILEDSYAEFERQFNKKHSKIKSKVPYLAKIISEKVELSTEYYSEESYEYGKYSNNGKKDFHEATESLASSWKVND